MSNFAFSHRTARPQPDTPLAYGEIAHRYDHAHRRWLRGTGRQAQDAFDGAAAAIVQPGFRVLDAGCGTAAVAKRLIRLCHGHIDVHLLDVCPEMLETTGPMRAEKRLGRLEDIPFPQGQFDLVTCAWALEATTRPMNALRELVRVTRPGGMVCFVSSANFGRMPLVQRMVHRNVQRRGLGRLLTPAEIADIPTLFPKASVRLMHVGHTSVLGLIRKEARGSAGTRPCLPKH